MTTLLAGISAFRPRWPINRTAISPLEIPLISATDGALPTDTASPSMKTFEGLAMIESWARDRGHDTSRTFLFEGETPPDSEKFDWLVIMGGRVRKNKHREIGWHPVSLTPEGSRSDIFGVLPERFVALHWHGDTFEIPPYAVWTTKSEACKNQAFQLGRAIGLQFHLEATAEGIESLIRYCSDELSGGGEFVQAAEEILAGFDAIPEMNGLMFRFLDEVERRYGV